MSELDRLIQDTANFGSTLNDEHIKKLKNELLKKLFIHLAYGFKSSNFKSGGKTGLTFSTTRSFKSMKLVESLISRTEAPIPMV